jgi:hypothetical protein
MVKEFLKIEKMCPKLSGALALPSVLFAEYNKHLSIMLKKMPKMNAVGDCYANLLQRSLPPATNGDGGHTFLMDKV